MRQAGNKAASLITTLLVIVVLSTIVVAFLQSMSIDRLTANSSRSMLQAELAARAGLNRPSLSSSPQPARATRSSPEKSQTFDY